MRAGKDLTEESIDLFAVRSRVRCPKVTTSRSLAIWSISSLPQELFHGFYMFAS